MKIQPTPNRRADQYDDPDFDYSKYWQGRAYEHAAEEMAISRLLSGKHFKHALDVGGGYGRLSLILKQYADSVTLVEPSHFQLDRAEHFLSAHPDIQRVRAAAASLPYQDGYADLLVLIRVMHHLPDPSAELKEVHRVLADDGYAVIEVANYSHARNRMHYLLHHKKLPTEPVDIRTPEHKNPDEIDFVNHNPKTFVRQLKDAGLKVDRILSVSNLRSQKLKKLMPQRVMLAIEGILQPTLAHGYFGPSVFFLVEKAKKLS